MTKNEKVIEWIRNELEVKKRRKPRPPRGEYALSTIGWEEVFLGHAEIRVANLSKPEIEFALEAVRACGFKPRW